MQPDEYIVYRHDTSQELFRVLAGMDGNPSCGMVYGSNVECLTNLSGGTCVVPTTTPATSDCLGICTPLTVPTAASGVCPAECLAFAYRDVSPNGVYTFPRPTGVTQFRVKVNGACPGTVWSFLLSCS